MMTAAPTGGLEGKRRFKNQVAGRKSPVRPIVPPKNNNQRAQTVGGRVRTAKAAVPQPMTIRMIVAVR
jgi:hypothetical protein